MPLPPGEPAAGPWQQVSLPHLATIVRRPAGAEVTRPWIVAIDGRGASGKSTLAARLHALEAASAVVHTDDLAWHEPLFSWGHLLAHVLRSLHEERSLSYRPPQWEQRGREGIIVIPPGTDIVFVEGTGASQREHADLVDATIWVQSDFREAERRGIARDVAEGVNGDPDQAVAFWHEWMTAEVAFLDRQQPWRRACVVVNGTPRGRVDVDQVEIASPPVPGSQRVGTGPSDRRDP